MVRHHLILGAGPAGVIAAESLRKLVPQDRVTLVGDEPELPYSRMAIPYLLMGSIDERGTLLGVEQQRLELQIGLQKERLSHQEKGRWKE